MKKLKKLSLITSGLLLAFSLASCDKESNNTSVPVGSLDLNSVIASSGDLKLTNDVFYSQLRYNGYNTVLNNIKSDLFEKEITEVKAFINFNDSNVTDYERSLYDIFASSVFGTSDAEAIEDMSDKDINTSVQKYIDSCNNKGISLTKNDCLDYEIVDDEIVFKSIPQTIINQNLTSIAINKAAKDKLLTIVDSEKIEDKDEEGKMVTNTNYIKPESIESYYDSSTKTYGSYQAIIVQFNTLTEAKNAVKATEDAVGALNDQNAEKFYATLYNTYYNYRSELDVNDPFKDLGENSTSKTTFLVNADKDELTEISATVKTMVTTVLEEDYQYFDRPFNQNNKYVMVYRGETKYEINEKYNITPLNEQVKWNDLKDNSTAYDEVYAEIHDKLVDNKVSSYTSTIINDRIEAAEIKIFDPFFESKFASSYTDLYENIEAADFNNDNIYELVYNEKTYTYSVADFYAEQALANGVSIIFNQLSKDYAYSLKDLFLDADKIEELEKAVDTALETFNKDENAAYPKKLGEKTYLLASYGYSTVSDVKKYQVANSALSSYLSQTIFDEWAKKDENGKYTTEINLDKLNALNNILAAGNENYNSLFSINIDHMLIFIDDNADGNPDDPEAFTKNFSAAEKAEFEASLVALSQAIYNEANCEKLTKSNDLMEILNYIVEAYSKNEELYSSETGATWADYKKYNFQLKVESLSSSGDTTQNNVTNYVTEFADYVKELYATAKENKLEVSDDEPKFYFTGSLDKAPAEYSDLCATQFGFHMIVVNDYDEPTSTKKTAESDSNGYQKEFEVLLNENDKDDTDDNVYVIVPNTYNDKENEATIYQLFTYYVQNQTGAFSTLDSNIKEVIANMFGTAISRYSSTNFQNYLLYNVLNVTVSYQPLATNYANYKDYLKRTSQSYDADDKLESWYSSDIDWTRPYDLD